MTEAAQETWRHSTHTRKEAHGIRRSRLDQWSIVPSMIAARKTPFDSCKQATKMIGMGQMQHLPPDRIRLEVQGPLRLAHAILPCLQVAGEWLMVSSWREGLTNRVWRADCPACHGLSYPSKCAWPLALAQDYWLSDLKQASKVPCMSSARVRRGMSCCEMVSC